MRAHTNRDVGPRVNTSESIMSSRLRDLIIINPPIFLGSIAGKDPQEFLDEVYKIIPAMGIPFREIAELASYQLKNVTTLK